MVFSRDMGISRFSERSVVFTRKAAINLNFRLDAIAVKILFYLFIYTKTISVKKRYRNNKRII